MADSNQSSSSGNSSQGSATPEPNPPAAEPSDVVYSPVPPDITDSRVLDWLTKSDDRPLEGPYITRIMPDNE